MEDTQRHAKKVQQSSSLNVKWIQESPTVLVSFFSLKLSWISFDPERIIRDGEGGEGAWMSEGESVGFQNKLTFPSQIPTASIRDQGRRRNK